MLCVPLEQRTILVLVGVNLNQTSCYCCTKLMLIQVTKYGESVTCRSLSTLQMLVRLVMGEFLLTDQQPHLIQRVNLRVNFMSLYLKSRHHILVF